MPTTVTDSAGGSHHLFQLSVKAPEPTDEHAFTTLDNPKAEGYRSTSLLGVNTGLRTFPLSMPTLTGSSVIAANVTDPYGATVSQEQYIRNLYQYNRSTGAPFVYQWPDTTGQYYLVDFADEPLSMKKTKGVNIYATECKFVQRRLNGITVFDYTKTSNYQGGAVSDETYNQTTHNDPVWRQVFYSGLTSAPEFDATSCTFGANPQNGFNTVRLTAASSSYLAHKKLTGYNSVTIYDMFLVMKMRETTFTGNAGIVASTTSANYLRGAGGTALFSNLSLSNFEYRKNGTLYAQSAMAAPMNAFGVVHLRFSAGQTIAAMNIGQSIAGVYANMDIGEIRMTNSLMPLYEAREYTEYLQIKWAIT